MTHSCPIHISICSSSSFVGWLSWELPSTRPRLLTHPRALSRSWERFEPVAKRLAEFASGRTATWAISPDLAVQEYLTTAVVPTEEELFQDSLAFEPAEDARRASATLKRSRSRESTEKAVVRASSSEVTDSSVSTASDVRTGGRGSGVSDPTSVTASAAKRPTVLASQAAVPTQQLESDGDDTDSFEC